jgi:hypothetical protein
MPIRNRITARTRSDLIDWLSSGPHHWAGAENEDAFLGRLFDLRSLPTTDSRRTQYPTAAEDIWQHRVNNSDWADDWVFTDPRFNIRHDSDERFLNFIVATVQVRVREDPEAAAELIQIYNASLQADGFEIVETRRVGGLVYYGYQRTSGMNSPTTVDIAPIDVRDTAVLQLQLARLKRDIDTDPPAAIAHCKELLESQCKLVLSDLGVAYNERDDLPQLYRAASTALGIHADSIPENRRASDSVKGILRALQSVVQNVAEARNAMGTGHGRESESPAKRRHARLVFNATVTIAEFVADTWSVRAEND